MVQGKAYRGGREGRMLWNNVDVRDVARAHRLCVETTVGANGSRYILSASDRSAELYTWQLQTLLESMYPMIDKIGGEPMEGDLPAQATYDSPRAYCLLALQELGLEPYDIETTIRDTVDSYYALGILRA
jgi:nucleoside-diphosphate-sugar epimerase